MGTREILLWVILCVIVSFVAEMAINRLTSDERTELRQIVEERTIDRFYRYNMWEWCIEFNTLNPELHIVCPDVDKLTTDPDIIRERQDAN